MTRFRIGKEGVGLLDDRVLLNDVHVTIHHFSAFLTKGYRLLQFIKLAPAET